MKWRKLGQIFKPEHHLALGFVSHAQVPVANVDEKNGVTVYYSSRDERGRSHPFQLRLNQEDLSQIEAINPNPILGLGDLGTFDDCGVMPSWITKNGEHLYLYYIGWNVRNTIPYHNAVGLAISTDGGSSFQRYANFPLWDRGIGDPHYSGTSCVIFDKGKWKNWYLSCTEWREIDGKSEPRYHIKYAESADGIHWTRDQQVAIDYANDSEAGIVKASVIVEDGLYKMWYSYRKFKGYRHDKAASYKIGYAESADGVSWQRMDRLAGIGLSDSDWDSEMLCYPHVFDYRNERYMLYNGNGFGQSGFGIAILENE